MKTLNDYAAHIIALCKQHRIGLTINPAMPAERSSVTHFGPGYQQHQLTITTMTDETHYAVVMHELGHCLAPGGMSESGPDGPRNLKELRSVILGEMAAWDWAEANAIDWTTGMNQCRQLALDYYRSWAIGKMRGTR